MTRLEIVTIAVRLVALWLFLTAIATIATTASAMIAAGMSIPGVILLPVLLLAVSVLTWAFATPLALAILPAPDPGIQVVGWGIRDVERLAFRLMGVWLLVRVAGSFTYLIIQGMVLGPDESDAFSKADLVAQLVSEGVVLILAVALIAGRDRLEGLWGAMRTPGGLERMDEGDAGDVDAELRAIVAYLSTNKVRATYGAVGEVLGLSPQTLDGRLGDRRPEASWIVNKESGRPTGYRDDELDPAFSEDTPLLTTGDDLRARLQRG